MTFRDILGRLITCSAMRSASKKDARPVAVDLFSGAGGMSLGFEQAGFDVKLAVDYDPYHVAAHHRNFPYGSVIHGSVAELSGKEILERVDTTVDLVFGGPPCQGFSHMGQRDLLDPRSTLVAEFARIVSEVRPRAFVMENVPGMASGKTSAIFEDAIERFRAAGYVITWPPRRLNAKDFGVPQDRERLFVIGTRTDLSAVVEYPEGRCDRQPGRPTVIEAIGDLPLPAAAGDCQEYPEVGAAVSDYALVARGIKQDPSDRSRRRVWDSSVCTGCSPVIHSAAVTELYSATPPGQMVPGHKLPRLSPVGISPTLRAGSNSERGSHTAPRPVHPVYPRCITVREAARLHGYPDWFLFYPGKWHAYQQIGNSVCPPVARAVGAQIVKALKLRTEVPTEPVVLNAIFELPAKGTQHRRIVQLDEFPKVLAFLLSKKGADIGTMFSTGDVAEAYAETGAEMPRVRPNQFFATLGRSRNIQRLLKPLHDLGRTLRVLNGTDQSATIVPFGTPGAIDDKDSIKVSSASLLEAVVLRGVELPCDDDRPFPLRTLAGETLLGLLGAEKWKTLRPDGSLFWEEGKRTHTALAQKGRRTERILVSTCVGHQLPARSRLAEGMMQHKCNKALLAARVTTQHLLLAVFSLEDEQAIECERVVVRIAPSETDRRAVARLEP